MALKTRPQQGKSAGVAFTTSILETFATNYGTHIDFPAHIHTLADTRAVSQFPLSSFIREGVIVDVRDCINKELFRKLDQDNRVPLSAFGPGVSGLKQLFEAIMEMEITKAKFLSKCPVSLKGKAVLFYTGLDRFWRYTVQPCWRYAYFLNPFLSVDLANFLVEQGAALVGSDSLQIECPLFNISPEDDFPGLTDAAAILGKYLDNCQSTMVHKILLGNSVCIVENLRNLEAALPGPLLFVAAPLKFGYPICDNSPTRAFAIVPRRSATPGVTES